MPKNPVSRLSCRVQNGVQRVAGAMRECERMPASAASPARRNGLQRGSRPATGQTAMASLIRRPEPNHWQCRHGVALSHANRRDHGRADGALH